MAKNYNYNVMLDDNSIDVSKEVGLVWSIANSLRGAYTSDKYKDVIIPMVIIRRFECALAATKQAVIEKYEKAPTTPAALLEQISGYPFYNTSKFTLKKLLNDSDGIAENFKSYIDGFSANVQTIINNLEFKKQIDKLDKNNRLYGIVKKFSDIDFDPASIDGMKMGYIFEDIIRRFSENAEAGDHYTPREVIRLLVNVLLAEGCNDLLTEEGKVATVLDAACGSGGMLSTTHDFLVRKNPYVDVRLFGQEINPESYAICMADMLIKGEDARNIKGGDPANTLKTDCFPNQKMRLIVMNPPFGTPWGGKDAPDGQEKAVRDEHKKGGRFEKGLPASGDAQLLFMQHIINKMDDKNGRAAIISNGSPLFSGGTTSGESQIRRWMLEEDLIEAIIALPSQLFYNTDIGIYAFILSKNKRPDRKGKVQLINAVNMWKPLRKSLGKKRREIDRDSMLKITELYANFEETPECKIFANEEFMYREYSVWQPLQRRAVLSKEAVEELKNSSLFTANSNIFNVADFEQLEEMNPRSAADEKKYQKYIKGRQFVADVIAILENNTSDTVYMDFSEFEKHLKGLLCNVEGLSPSRLTSIAMALKFKAGCLAHFAMDLNEVYMCTNLKGKSSFFLPFNKGCGEGINSGKGNPHNDDGINVSYMWEDILKKDTVIYLIDKIIFLQKETKKNADTGKRETKETLIFPRYHQFNAVRKVVNDVIVNHSEKNYLIQHSAGSGKTNTIAWLAHRLASLHDAEDNVIFDTVCIITDRIVVDRQLQNAVLSLEHKAGLIKVMDDKCTSKDLAEALNGNTKIIVTTIHKFMYIHELVSDLKNKTFAVIIDEAHSSTAGSAMESVTYTLSESRKLSEATPTDINEDEPSMADIIEDEIARSGKQDNVSMIAFTATPKPTTLQLFGSLNEEGKKVAFDLYSMKQAIEEGFILDVLKNYVTYQTYYKINKSIEDDPELESIAAKRKIAKYIELHDTNIAQKVEIIIEHFKNHIMKELGGRAKAMVITSSRQAAVKYRNEFVNYVTKHGYTGIHALVAFSGKVSLDGNEYTEAVMNGISEGDLPEAFDSNDYQVLLVANKYQTGFDQPKLCAMYVDKRLRGVSAVQTLSRLNRICAPFDKKTFVLDFKNEYDDIQKAFSPFYTETILNETITPSDIRAVEAQVDQYNFLDIDDIESFNEYLYQEKRTANDKAKMWSLLDKSLQIINKFGPLEKMEIRSTIKRFIRFYSFLIQATCYENVDLHKKYNFLSYLVKEIEIGGGGNDFDIADKITASNFKQKKTGEQTREIESKPEVDLPKPNEVFFDEAAKKKLSEIIDEINAAYNKNFDVDVASKSALQMRDLLLKNGHLRDSARNNSLKDFRFAYFDAVQEALIEGYEQNQDFFALLLDNDEKKRELMQVFLEDVYKNLREG